MSPRVTFHRAGPGPQPGGWHREDVRLDGSLIGYLTYRVVGSRTGRGPGWTQYLISDRDWNPVGGDDRQSYLDRVLAVDMLVAHATTGSEVTQ